MLGWFKKSESRAADSEPEFVPSLPIDLLQSDFVADPYPTYAWLRRHCPVAEIAGGGFLVTRYEDIKSALSDPNLGNAPSRFSTLSPRNAGKYVAADLASHITPFLDGAEHVKMRQMTSRTFYNTLKMAAGDVDDLAKIYVKALKIDDDMIQSAAQPFSLQVMCHFCGIDADTAQMKHFTQAFFHLFAPLKDQAVFQQVNTALLEFRSVISQSLSKGPPAHSLLFEMQKFQRTHGDVTDEQIIDNCLLVFADGVENIEAGAAALLMLFEKFNVFALLEKGEIGLEQAIREGLRLETPAQLIPRVAKANCQIGAVDVKKDMPVFLALGAGNRDETVFEAPDIFDVNRELQNVLTFGQGRHRCVGEPLAMMQLNAMMSALINAGIRPILENVSYQNRIGHRWPSRVRVKKA